MAYIQLRVDIKHFEKINFTVKRMVWLNRKEFKVCLFWLKFVILRGVLVQIVFQPDHCLLFGELMFHLDAPYVMTKMKMSFMH